VRDTLSGSLVVDSEAIGSYAGFNIIWLTYFVVGLII